MLLTVTALPNPVSLKWMALLRSGVFNQHEARTQLKWNMFGLNIFYSSQDIIKDRAERKVMFSSLHEICLNQKIDNCFINVSFEHYYLGH